MIVVGILASIILLVVIIRFALSKQVDTLVKRAAIIALAVIGAAIVVCLIAIISGPKVVEEEPVFVGFSLEEPVQQATNPAMVYALVFGVIMVLFMGLIIYLSLKETKKNKKG